jgi:hypothetical protein
MPASEATGIAPGFRGRLLRLAAIQGADGLLSRAGCLKGHAIVVLERCEPIRDVEGVL